MLPKKTRALLAIKELMEAIDGTGEYVNTVSAVSIGRGLAGQEERPFISINDQQSSRQSEGLYRAFEYACEITVDCFCKTDEDEPGIAASLLEADVKRALGGAKDQKLRDDDGEIGAIKFVSSQSLAVDNGSDIEGYRITLEAIITEKWGNPT